MLSDWITQMDINILNWIQENLRSDLMDSIMQAVTFLGEVGWLFILIAVILLLIPKWRIWGAKLATALGFGFVFGNLLLKNVFARVRPYEIVENITLLIEKQNDFSFPSGHTLAAFECFTVIYYMPVKKRYKILAGIVACAIAFSRLYLYMHYPSDVIGGIVLGTAFGVMGVRVVDMIAEERKNK